MRFLRPVALAFLICHAGQGSFPILRPHWTCANSEGRHACFINDPAGVARFVLEPNSKLRYVEGHGGAHVTVHCR